MFKCSSVGSVKLVRPPVEADDAQVEDGGGGGEDVHRVPEVAHHGAEYPQLVHALQNIENILFMENLYSVIPRRLR